MHFSQKTLSQPVYGEGGDFKKTTFKVKLEFVVVHEDFPGGGHREVRNFCVGHVKEILLHVQNISGQHFQILI